MAGPALLRALVFDMDGTLFDSTAAVTEAYREAVLRGGGRSYAPDEVVAAYPLGPPKAILSHLLGRPCEAADLQTYHGLLERLTHRLMVYRGVPETLQALGAKGVPLAVFTGASREAARIVLAGGGLLRHFSVVVGATRSPGRSRSRTVSSSPARQWESSARPPATSGTRLWIWRQPDGVGRKPLRPLGDTSSRRRPPPTRS